MFESKRRAFLFMLGSIFFGLVAVILFADYMSEMKASLGEYVTVHVAKTDIAAGKPITDDMVAEKQIPRKFMLDSLIHSKEELRGKISLVPIAKGSVITTSMLRNNTIVTGDFRQVMLHAPLAVFDDQIDTFDKVDLVVSYDAGSSSGAATEDKRVTEVLLKNVTVNRVDKKGEELVAIGVVLKLDDAQKVIWALNYGKEVRVLKSASVKVQREAENGTGDQATGKKTQPDQQGAAANPGGTGTNSASQ